MTFTFTVAAVIPASPKEIYDAWLDGKTHARMTGSDTARGSTKVGGAHEAWDGYIAGRNLVLTPGKRIVQSWRTTEFTSADADSQIEVKLTRTPRGTRVTLIHSNVPDGHTGYRGGWVDHYFVPMKAYFAAQAKAKPAAKTKAKAKATEKRKPARRVGKKKKA